MLAANLLRRPPASATDIVLIERSACSGPRRGVRKPRISLSSERAGVPAVGRFPRSLCNFCGLRASRLEHVDGEDFLPRALYGDYLQDLLLQAERAAPAHIRLVRVFGEVTRIGAGRRQAAGGAIRDSASPFSPISPFWRSARRRRRRRHGRQAFGITAPFGKIRATCRTVFRASIRF